MPPAYPHECANAHAWDVWSTIARRDEPAACPQCSAPGVRLKVVPTQVMGAGAWNEQAWNPGLGCVTAGTKDAERKAKDRGLIPVGSEPADRLHAKFDKDRAERREQRYRDAADLK